MDASSNPYTPGSGRPPVELVGRNEDLKLFSSLITRSARSLGPDQPILLLGLRGVGKTVLLNRMLQEAENADWVAVKFEASPGRAGATTARQILIQGLNAASFARSAQASTSRVRQMLATITSFNISLGLTDVSFGVARDPGRASTSNYELDLLDAVIDTAEVLRDENKGIAFFIDELQDLDPGLLAALLSCQHECSQRALPFYIIGAGLPNLPKILAETKSYAERMFNVRIIDSLNAEETRAAFLGPAHAMDAEFDDIALGILAKASQGYPYFIQELGSAMWRVAEGSPFTVHDARNALLLGFAQLDSGFFPARWDRATPAERNYLSAMAFDGPQPSTTSSIAERLGKKVQSLGPIRASLISKGLIYSPELGRVAFTVPGFHDFIQRRTTLAE